MTSETDKSTHLRFGVFALDLRTFELTKSGRVVRLGLQPARVLAALALRSGHLVSREDLQREIWGEDTFVDFDAGLFACINQIRSVLDDRASSPRFIETLPRRGYRFLADVRLSTSGEEQSRDNGSSPSQDRSPVMPATACPSTIPLEPIRPVATWLSEKTIVRLVAASLMGAAVFIGARLWLGPAPAATHVVTMLVLPIDTSGDSPDVATAAQVMTEAIVGDLATAAGPRVHVLSRLAAANLIGDKRSLDAIKALGADYFVDVSLRPTKESVRVHAKLARVSGWILWSTDYDLAPGSLALDGIQIAGTIARRAAREVAGSPGGTRTGAPNSAAVAPRAPASVVDRAWDRR